MVDFGVSAARSRSTLLMVFGATGALFPIVAHGASAQVHGHGALVGEYTTNVPPNNATYQGWRVPLSLTLEGRASNNLSLFLDVGYAYNQYPNVAKSLGNGDEVDRNNTAPQVGTEVSHPFAVQGGRGEKPDVPTIGAAYLQYASEVGLFRAGRIPRHWGLGLWRNAEWVPEGGTLSTTDAVSATFDLTSAFSGSLYLEKNSEGQATSAEDDADAFTVEALLADDPADVGSSGVARQIGVAFSTYEHKQSSTSFRVLDLFTKLYVGPFVAEGEIVYPSGKTKSLGYSSLGGKTAQCPTSKNERNLAITCDSQKFEGLASLIKLRYQLGGTPTGADKSLNIAATEAARLRQPTSLLVDSHTVGMWLGYSKGDRDSFAGVEKPDETINAVPMHPNIRPSLLMFNVSSPQVAGMPGGAVMNSLFVRGDYTYESPSFGSITPALVWSRLDVTNSKAGASPNAVGKAKDLGVEFDLSYSYKTADNVKLSVDSGVWFPGKAWRSDAGGKTQPMYGVRTTASTSF